MIQKRVLLAEDDQDDRMIFEEFLEDRKDFLLVSAVENGVEIFEFLNNLESESLLPQLIILDKNMPKINGVEALKLIKSEERFRNISVVIYSTYIDQNLINTCKALGRCCYFT
jgi:CheY-like chemotaxis protein